MQDVDIPRYASNVGRFSVEEVEAVTGESVAVLTFMDWETAVALVEPTDMIDHPVRVKSSGMDAMVVDVSHGGERLVVRAEGRSVEDGPYAGAASWGLIGEPIEVGLDEVVPLCIDCYEPLLGSDDMSPGECRNARCFLRQTGPTFND